MRLRASDASYRLDVLGRTGHPSKMSIAPPRASRPDDEGAPFVLDALAFDRADEAQLAAGRVGVRAAVLSARSVSYGIGVSESAAYVRRAAARGIPRVHRSTGGTGLLHEPGDLLWTVVLPRNHPALAGGYTRAYPRLGAGVVLGLRTVAVDAGWVPAPGLLDRYCTLSGRGSVLAAGPWVIGGAAQHLAGPYLLHHGVVSGRIDRSAIADLFEVPIGPATERLGSLADVIDPVPTRTVARAVRAAIAADLAIPELD
jgi:lipoate-protein ligase A